jgi:transposase-like protein
MCMLCAMRLTTCPQSRRRLLDETALALRWQRGGGRRDLAAWLLRWQEKYPRLCSWVEENIEETLTFYRLPREHHKHLKSTNMLERLNRQIKPRTRVIGIFPTRKAVCDSFEASGRNPRRLDRSSRYLNMEMLRDPPFRSQIMSPQRNRGLGLHR